MSTPLIEARGVTKILSGVVPVTLVQDIDLTIMPREFIAITGPSGSGKSSLLYLLGLLDLPTDGEVLIDGRSTTAMTEDERAEVRLTRLGFVFQFHFLLPEFSITENVALPMRALGRLSPARHHRARRGIAGIARAGRPSPQDAGSIIRRSAAARRGGAGARQRSAGHSRGRADRKPGFGFDRAGVRHPSRPGGAATARPWSRSPTTSISPRRCIAAFMSSTARCRRMRRLRPTATPRPDARPIPPWFCQ